MIDVREWVAHTCDLCDASETSELGAFRLRPMPINIDIAHVAKLARLDLTEDEMAHYRDQLGIILDHAALVQSLETEGTEPTAHPLQLVNGFRQDVVTPSLDRDEILAQAPESRDGYFVVPPSLESE